ncbi:MAG: MGMT family protein [Burkholderiales bacterium]|nr:MGMT family protein [Burkholderiales bacterium]
MSSDLYQSFYAIIRKIPRGKVATYGQIAALAGHPRHARHVGFALSSLPAGSKVPWHRVVNSQGQISRRGLEGNDEWQRVLLEEEGVEFSAEGRIALKRFRWE